MRFYNDLPVCNEVLEFIDIKHYIDNQITEYKEFMDITSEPFPQFDIQVDRNLQKKEIEESVEVLARAKYVIDTGKHKLCVSPDIVNDKSNVILYHELTHILDTEMHCKKLLTVR